MLHDSTDFGSTNTIGLYAFCYDTRERFDVLHGDFYEAICRWRRKLGDNRGIKFFFVGKDDIFSLSYWMLYILYLCRTWLNTASQLLERTMRTRFLATL
jgi:hypothetical protein